MKVAIIGGGNMGGAFARAFLEKGIVTPADLLIVEKSELRRKELQEDLECRLAAEVGPEISSAAVFFLAVKPQQMKEACAQFVPHLKGSQIVVSILAGITLASLGKALNGHKNIIRCMPNTPAQIGMGMSVFTASKDVPKKGREQVQELFEAAGLSLYVEDEKFLDAATAISGSGPAYVFYFIEHMLKAAKELGFSVDDSEMLVAQTLAGALGLWTASGESAEELRARVTSKGGTTEAAVQRFDAGSMGAILVEGIKRADERCRELQKSVEEQGN
jgi:pyrroline-5-carboxylate reductase